MTSIVIVEKPDQARKFKPHLGGRYGEFYAARGHLFELMPPEKLKPDLWTEWSIGLMRDGDGFYPSILKAGDPDIKRRYEAIREAAKRADTIYIATDPDREGEGIGGDIVNKLKSDIGWDGRVMRVLITGEDAKSLQDAFAAAQPAANFAALYQSYKARSNADHIFNLSLTRSASKALLPEGVRGSVSVGRVLTPTFGMVARRELAIRNFVARDYFHPWVEVHAAPDKTVRLTHSPAEEKRIFEEPVAWQLAEQVTNYAGPISVKRERKRQKPPRLFSLSQLQVEASRRLKWSVDKTTDVMQSIYDKGIATYPRSKEVSLWEADIPNAPRMKQGILALGFMGSLSFAGDEPVIRREKGAFSDKDLKGSAHYAIVPNINTVDKWGEIYASLSGDEKRLFEVIARRYMAAISPERVYDATKLSIRAGDREYAATGTVEISPGWRETLGIGTAKEADEEEDEEEDSGRLPDFKDGEAVKAVKVGVQALKTKPPVRYTDASLIVAMIEAWKEVADPQLRAILKGTEGIGTEATRKDIVPNLFKRGYAKLEGGKVYATEAGLKFFDTLMRFAPKLLDIGMTGEMEMMLDDIKSGDVSAKGTVDKICQVALEAIDGLVKAKSAGIVLDNLRPKGGKGGKPTTAMQNAAKAKAKREGKTRVPPGVLTDFDKCRAYLGEMKPRAEGDGPRPPSDAQKGFAQKIAVGAGVEIPAEALASAKALSEWIEAHKDSAGLPSGPRPPSEAQLNFARKIAADKGVEIPAKVLESGKAVSEWIEKNKQGGKGASGGARKAAGRPAGGSGAAGAPSPKAVGYAESIAARKKLTIPDYAMKDRVALNKWIDANKG